jgi:hypothetical protein
MIRIDLFVLNIDREHMVKMNNRNRKKKEDEQEGS